MCSPTQKYESDMLTFINSGEFKVHGPAKIWPWSLDGEYQAGGAERSVHIQPSSAL